MNDHQISFHISVSFYINDSTWYTTMYLY